jgi:hypothetical protein
MQTTEKKQANHLATHPPTRKLIELQAALARKMRKKRIALFESLIAPLPGPLRILDVGGEQRFWEIVGLVNADASILLYNLAPNEVTYPTLTSMVGNACDMSAFRDNQFQIVFSNSVIEHVGTFAHQRQMAAEIQRVGERYYVQTPSRFFPLEPHFLLPFFQFLPVRLRVFLVTHFNVGWRGRIPDKAEALLAIQEIRLLTKKELKCLFPGAKVYKEKFLGITKSFIVYGGWESDQHTENSAALREVHS